MLYRDVKEGETDAEGKLLENKPYKYCDSGDQICKTKTAKALRPEQNAALTANEYCTSGFHPGETTGNNVRNMPDGRNDKRCFALANYGCTVADDVAASTVCIDFKQTTGAGTKKCSAAPVTPVDDTKVIVGLDAECGKKNTDGKDLVCGYNLYCNANRKCATASRVGEPCGTTSGVISQTCMNGLTCVNKRCYPKYSIPFGASCDRDNSYACASGYCSDASVCGKTLTQTDCTKDADCVPLTTLNANLGGGIHVTLDSTQSVCLVSEPQELGKKGVCSAFFQPAAADLEQCIFRECQAAEGATGYNPLCKETISPNKGIYTGVVPANHPCQKQWVQRMCATYCVQQPDRRYVSDVPYVFDCGAQTASKMADNSCSVTTQFEKCAQVRSYKSDGARVGARVIVGAVFVALVALVTF